MQVYMNRSTPDCKSVCLCWGTFGMWACISIYLGCGPVMAQMSQAKTNVFAGILCVFM